MKRKPYRHSSDTHGTQPTEGEDLAVAVTSAQELQGKSSAKAQITAMPAANTSRVTEPVEKPASYLPVLMIAVLILLLIYM